VGRGARDSLNASLSSAGLALFLLGARLSLAAYRVSFFFGIPKSVADLGSTPPMTNNAAQRTASGSELASAGRAAAQAPPFARTSIASIAAAPNPRAAYTVNTNLEQISDWLTKIIVGVSLVEFDTIRNRFYELAEYFGDGFSAWARRWTVNLTAAVSRLFRHGPRNGAAHAIRFQRYAAFLPVNTKHGNPLDDRSRGAGVHARPPPMRRHWY
jgi:hypothetical protein